MKTCSKCKDVKPLASFNKHNGNKTGYQTMCVDCSKEYCKSRYRQNPELYKSRNRKAREKCRSIINELKSKPCTDCNVQYPPYVMDFDHLPEHLKRVGIAEAVNNMATTIFLEEIKKCELVCANCHRERTHKRKQAGVA